MNGPHVRTTIGEAHLSFSVVGILTLTGVLWIVLTPKVPEDTPDLQAGLIAGALAAAYLAVSWLLDRSLAGLSGNGELVGPTHFSMLGAVGVRRSAPSDHQHRNAVLAFAVYGAFGVLFLLIAESAHGGTSALHAAVFAVAAMSGASCLIRLCAIRGYPGGLAARWCLTILSDDEDVVDTAASVASYATGTLFAFSGFLVLSQPGQWSGWGLAGIAIGLECMVLTQWFNRRDRWIRAAQDRPLSTIGFSRLPTISHAAPISELLSIFAVEGNRAMVVVIDEAGRPTGLIQLRQLRAAVHSGRSAHPDEVMVTLSDVPHVPRETTVFDAALYLERTGQLALVTENTSDKPRVISLEELFRIVD